jgi:histidine triad (HIT) family protein
MAFPNQEPPLNPSRMAAPPPDDCFICRKHRQLPEHAGTPIARSGGLLLSHFPIIEGKPAIRGHLLIEPARHITDPAELSGEEAEALGGVVARGSALIRSALGAEHVYLFRINDLVAHLHFHLIPRYPGTPREYWGLKIQDWPEQPRLGLEAVRALSGELAAAFR